MTMHISRMVPVLSSLKAVGEAVGVFVGALVNEVGDSPSTTGTDITWISSGLTSASGLAVPARSVRSLINPTGSLLMLSSARLPISGTSVGSSPGRTGGRYSPVITTEKSNALDDDGRRRWLKSASW